MNLSARNEVIVLKQWILIRLRKEAGLRQEDMAKILDLHPDSYKNKENGKTDFKSPEMFKIANYFGKKMDEIFLPPDSILNRIIDEKSIVKEVR